MRGFLQVLRRRNSVEAAFFMLFQAGPDNFLNKLTWAVCHFRGWQILCYQRGQQIYPSQLQDSIGTTGQEITEFLLEFPL